MFAHRSRVLARFRMPLGWGVLFKRTLRDTRADDGLGLAAQLAFYFFLALFPGLLFALAVASFFPSHDLIGRVVATLQGTVPDEVLRILTSQIRRVTQQGHAGLLTFGAAAALWSSSAAMVALMDALNRADDVEDARSWWKQRGVALLLTIGAVLFLLVSIALVLAGPQLAGYVAERTQLGAAFEWAWKIGQWPLVFVLVTTAIGLIYHFAPNLDEEYAWLTPGSLLATALWFAGSLGFRYYVLHFGSYTETYGVIGGVIVLLLWLYLSGLAILLGAELNAEIRHAARHGGVRSDSDRAGATAHARGPCRAE